MYTHSDADSCRVKYDVEVRKDGSWAESEVSIRMVGVNLNNQTNDCNFDLDLPSLKYQDPASAFLVVHLFLLTMASLHYLGLYFLKSHTNIHLRKWPRLFFLFLKFNLYTNGVLFLVHYQFMGLEMVILCLGR